MTSGTPITDVIFPKEEDLSSDVSDSAVITIPAELIVERSNCKLQVTIDVRKYSFSYFPSFICSKEYFNSQYPVSESARLSTTRIGRVRFQL